MSTNTDFHFEQKQPQTVKDPRKEFFAKVYGKKTDRDLLEEQTHFAKLSSESNESIKKNMQFFFYLTLVSIGIFLISFVLENS